MSAEPRDLAEESAAVERFVSRAYRLMEQLDAQIHEAKADLEGQLAALQMSRDPGFLARVERAAARNESGQAEFVPASELASLDQQTRE